MCLPSCVGNDTFDFSACFGVTAASIKISVMCVVGEFRCCFRIHYVPSLQRMHAADHDIRFAKYLKRTISPRHPQTAAFNSPCARNGAGGKS